eukprot:476854-Prymnesium_polylepis.1
MAGEGARKVWKMVPAAAVTQRRVSGPERMRGCGSPLSPSTAHARHITGRGIRAGLSRWGTVPSCVLASAKKPNPKHVSHHTFIRFT